MALKYSVFIISKKKKKLLFKKHEMQMFKIVQSAYFDSMSVPVNEDADI